MGLIILPSISEDSGKARIGYDNIAKLATITPSSENASFPAENLIDWLPDDFFKPAGSGTITVTFELPSAQTADYFAFYNQDLYNHAGTIKLQYWDGAAWQDAFPAISPADNKPRMVFFTAQTSDEWRLVVTATGIFSLGVIAFGQHLALPNGMYRNWTPPVLADDDEVTNSESDNANFLGRSLVSRGAVTKLEINSVSDAWMRLQGRAFLDHAKVKPFFFVPNVVDYPSECTFCKTEGKIPPPVHSSYGYMSQSIPIRGRVK